MLLHSLSPFLKIGIICASVKKDGNFEVFTTLALYYANKKPENISAFSLTIFVGYLFDLFLHTSPIVSMIGWFLYFKIT